MYVCTYIYINERNITIYFFARYIIQTLFLYLLVLPFAIHYYNLDIIAFSAELRMQETAF